MDNINFDAEFNNMYLISEKKGLQFKTCQETEDFIKDKFKDDIFLAKILFGGKNVGGAYYKIVEKKDDIITMNVKLEINKYSLPFEIKNTNPQIEYIILNNLSVVVNKII